VPGAKPNDVSAYRDFHIGSFISPFLQLIQNKDISAFSMSVQQTNNSTALGSALHGTTSQKSYKVCIH
jgi:hypothetical protein